MSYGYSGTITIDHTKCGSSNSSNFPVLFALTEAKFATVTNGGYVQNTCTGPAPLSQSLPADLIFTSDSAGADLLNWEFESYNPSTGQVIIWIQVPTLSHTANTIIYVWCGNSAVTTWQGGSRGAVWDSNFVGVYHFTNGTTLNLTDATSGANNGTAENSPTADSGIIDGCLKLVESSSEYVTLGTGSAFDTAAITYSAWVKANSLPDAYNCIFKRGNVGGTVDYAEYFIKSNGKLACYVQSTTGGVDYDGSGSNTLSTGTWYHVVMVFSSSVGLIGYVNGASDGSASSSSPLETANDITTDIGYDRDTTPRGWDGWIDEVHVSSSARSGDWILSEYNNQSAPTTFSTWSGLSSTGGTTYTSTFTAATSSFSATLPKQPEKVLTAATASFAGAIAKSLSRSITAAMAAWSAVLSRAHIFAAALNAAMASFAGGVTKQTNFVSGITPNWATYAGALPDLPPWNRTTGLGGLPTDVMFRVVNFGSGLVAAMSSFAGAIVKALSRELDAAMTSFSAACLKQTARTIAAASAAWAATLSSAHVVLLTLTASMASFAGSCTKQAEKALAAAMTSFAGAVNIFTAKGMTAATSSFAASCAKQTERILSAATASWAGSIAKSIARELDASMGSFAAVCSKQTDKILAAGTSAWSAIISTGNRLYLELDAAMAAWSAQLPRFVEKSLAAATSSFAGSLVKMTGHAVAAAMSSFSGVCAKQTEKVVAAATSAWSATMAPIHVIVAVLNAAMASFAGSIARRTSKIIPAGMAGFAAGLAKRISKAIAASMVGWSGLLGAGAGSALDYLLAIAGSVVAGIVAIAGSVDQEEPEVVTVGEVLPGLEASTGSVTQGLLVIAGSVSYGLVAIAGGVDVKQ
jgi:hypothetical protein